MPSAHVLPYGLAAFLALLPGWQSEERAPGAPHAEIRSGATIERARDGFFYVEAKVDGVPVRFLVDTGASVAIISAGDARRIGLLMKQGNKRIRTVGGEVSMASATLPATTIAGRELIGVEAVVSPQTGTSLIGQRVLSQFASVTMRGDTMRFD
jgi:aspartyl protease family protein